jgi:predicted amidohydrolase
VGEYERNVARAVEAVRTAADHGARLVVLPELVTSGYMFADAAEARASAEPAEGPAVAQLTALASERDLVVVAGLPELAEQTLFNSAVIVDASGLRAVYRKVHLWDREGEFFTPGDAVPPVVETAIGRVGVMVCYDLEFPEWVRSAALRGADVVCAPTNWPAIPRPEGERPIEVVQAQASASINRVFLAVAARTGAERGVEWVSGSTIVEPSGYPLVLPDPGLDEQVLIASCRLTDARTKNTGPNNDVFGDRRPDLYASSGGP